MENLGQKSSIFGIHGAKSNLETNNIISSAGKLQLSVQDCIFSSK